MILDYNVFNDEIENIIYKNTKSSLLNKIARNPERYVGLFRTTSPRMKLIQNITQSNEISFGDFIESIITMYLGLFYENLPKRATYNNETIMFDQLFLYNDKIFMIEQKIRDDHDSTKKRGQYLNFISKINYLKENYPDKEISAIMWFVDNTLNKNRNYYLEMMNNDKDKLKTELNLFYGDELFYYLDQVSIWDELTAYLFQWKQAADNDVILNFENDWEQTKKEIYENITKSTWNKLLSNNDVVSQILPILFPTGKYKEINFD